MRPSGIPELIAARTAACCVSTSFCPAQRPARSLLMATLRSKLGRARTTAAVITSTLALPVDVIDDLREVHHGMITGLTDAQIERDHAHVADDRARDKYQYRHPGGESYADADRRVERAMDQIGATGTRRPLIVVGAARSVVP